MFRKATSALPAKLARRGAPGVGLTGATFTAARWSGTKRDHYEVLGVPKGAGESEIKKAYRKKAMETHPDRGGNKDEFSAVSEAYEVLSDTDKRSMYDRYGHDAANMGGMGGPGGMGGMGGRSPEDIFNDFFGGMGRGGAGGQPVVEDVDVQLKVTLEELYQGATKSFRVRRPQTCGGCRGEGTKKPGSKQQCTTCQGSGRIVQQVRMGPGMVQQVVQSCNRCGGKGTTIKPEDLCTQCRGDGFVNKSEELSVPMPAGVHAGSVLVMEGMGGEKPGAAPGNINLHLEPIPHRTFERRGDDLIVRRTVTLSEALLGMELRLNLLDGRTVLVRSEPGKCLKHNGVMTLLHEGMPRHGRGGRGHLYVVTTVAMPEKLTEDQTAIVEKAFGKPPRDTKIPDGAQVTAKPLRESFEQLEMAKQAEWAQSSGAGNNGGRRRRAAGGGAENVQCAQQ